MRVFPNFIIQSRCNRLGRSRAFRFLLVFQLSLFIYSFVLVLSWKLVYLCTVMIERNCIYIKIPRGRYSQPNPAMCGLSIVEHYIMREKKIKNSVSLLQKGSNFLEMSSYYKMLGRISNHTHGPDQLDFSNGLKFCMQALIG